MLEVGLRYEKKKRKSGGRWVEGILKVSYVLGLGMSERMWVEVKELKLCEK